MIPHQYPFRLIERRADGRAVAAVTAAAGWWRGDAGPPAALAVEILAQAAILLAPGGRGGPAGGLLAGVEGAAFARPLEPGDRLRVEIELRGRFGRLLKVSGRLVGEDGAEVAAAELLLAMQEG